LQWPRRWLRIRREINAGLAPIEQDPAPCCRSSSAL
jgi:hypothetical protein